MNKKVIGKYWFYDNHSGVYFIDCLINQYDNNEVTLIGEVNQSVTKLIEKRYFNSPKFNENTLLRIGV